MENFCQDAFVLQKLIETSTGDENSEATAYKLLHAFGSVEKAIGQFNACNSDALGIDPQLVGIFSAIHELNLNVLYQKISVEDYPLCTSRIVDFFSAQFPTRKRYIVQFFFFFRQTFLGSSRPTFGSINDVAILSRTVFAEALKNNADRIVPVIGLPDGTRRADDRITSKLVLMRESSMALEITTDFEITI